MKPLPRSLRRRLRRSLAAPLALLVAALPGMRAPAQTASPETPVRAQHAMVVSVESHAADAGLEILKEGGNAVDAAVATGFALAVTYPFAGNLGGGGFMLIRMHDGTTAFFDYREKAPLAATSTMYQDASGNVIPDASIIGWRAIGVPGSVAGMVAAERKYGRLRLKQVMAPAIRLAKKGFALNEEEAQGLQSKRLARFPDSRRIFQRNGDYYRAGEVFRQPQLAHTLKRIASHPDDFYHGRIAKKLAKDMRKNGGLITRQDLAGYQAKERTPLTGTYRGYTILSAPPPSSGGVALIETLNILEGYDLARMGDRSPEEIHYITEAFRRAFMDHADYLGDPDFYRVPVTALLSKRYAAAGRAGILRDRATPSASLVRPAGFLPPPPAGSPAPAERPNTTHYSIVDAEGNAVAVTTTLNGGYGSGVTAKGLGFLLNDEMDDFSSKPGAPNMFGLVQGSANAIAPGKRPLSSMTPTIVLQGGKLRMVLGSPGGPRIITTVANIFLSVADGGLNIQQAVDAPRFHHQYLPDVLYVEQGYGDHPGFPPATLARLKAMGYDVEPDGTWSDGECILIDPATGMLEAGQDQRQHSGKAAGY